MAAFTRDKEITASPDSSQHERPPTNTDSSACSRSHLDKECGAATDEDLPITDIEKETAGPPRNHAKDPEEQRVPEEDPYEVRWENGDADPLCPRSFKTWRKWIMVCVVCLGAFCVTFASSAYVLTYAHMDAEFGNSKLIATVGLSTFVLGLALGPYWSPLSEFYGRKPIYLVSFVLFMIWQVPVAVAKNIETVIVARFFQGLSGSGFLSISGGTVSDLFGPNEMQAPMAVFSICPIMAPSMGPLVGGFINSYTNWRWTHYTVLIFAAVLFLLILVIVPETYHPVLLRQKAIRLRKETGDDRWQAPIEKMQQSLTRTVGMSLLRPFQMLIIEPICFVLDVYIAILLGIVYLFFGAFPLVFMNNHGFNVWQTGLSFMGLAVGIISGGLSAPVWANLRLRLIRRNEKKTGIKGASVPEYRLPQVMLSAVLTPVGMFWFGWTTYSSIHWIVPMLGSMVFGMGVLLAFNGIFSFLVDAYTLYAASALAGNAFVRCVFGAAFPLFGNQMYEKLGYQWATSVLGFLTVAMLPFPFLFYRYGKALRSKSRYAVKS